ncbi:MAG TPA: FHA domain-containing protein [Gemmatimonadales bacterium]|nr:FHA domain-containing protein [Gemmatimonadales bacterium]
MSLLEMGGKRFTIPAGEVTLGSDPGSAVPLSGAGILAKHAMLKGLPDGQVVIRKATPEAEVTINGVRLGAEPTPLLHGDKVQVGGFELTFVDERRSGSTQYVAAMDLSKVAPSAAKSGAASAKPTGTTGGRVVCLTDGREYAVVGASLVFGREAGCDVVVPGKDVSRKHAEIHSSPKGYFVVDLSTNGTFVNEQRVEGQRVLARGDVVRIGEESFRFYADAAAGAPSPPPLPGPPPGGGPAASTPSPQPSPAPPLPGIGAGGAKLQNTSFGMPATPRPSGAAPDAPRRTAGTPAPSTPSALGNFLVRSGSLKGQRLTLKTPNISVGRADYNDLVFPDESVSTAHAKLQRREGVWVLIDLESTNGTFVDGEKITADAPLAPGALVRFGDVQLVFEPTDDALGVTKGGGTKVMTAVKAAEAPKPSAPPAAPPPAPKAAGSPLKATVPSQKPLPTPKAPAPPKRPASPPASQPSQEKKGKGCGASASVIVLSAAALAYWFLA